MAAERLQGARIQSALVLAIRVGGAVLQMLLVAVVALRFPIEAVGLNGLIWAIALVARMAGTFGLDVAGMRAQSPLWDEGRAQEAMALGRRDGAVLRRIWLVLGAVGLAAAAAVQLGGGRGEWVVMGLLVAAASASSRLHLVQRTARRRPLTGQLLESAVLPGLGLIAALIASAAAPGLLIPGQVLCFLVVAVIRGRRAPSSGRRCEAAAIGPGELAPVPWRSALTMGAGSALTALCVRGPMFVLGTRSLAMTGAFEVAQKVQSAGSMGTSAVATVYMPRIAMSVRHRARLARLLAEAAIASALIPVLLLVFLLALGEDRLVDLLGPEYRGAWLASVLMVAATLVNALTSASSNVLMLGGGERAFTAISAVQLGVVVGGSWLAGTDTATGMAWWVLIGETLRAGAMTAGMVLHMRALGRTPPPVGATTA